MRTLFFAIAMLFPFVLCAQNHLQFKGVEIDGKFDKFLETIVAQGYEKIYEKDGNAVVKGDFTNKSAEIFILSSKRSHTVWKVSVRFDKAVSWSSLESSYEDYVRLFTEKYGKPTKHYEFFSKPYFKGDSYELQALRMEKCHYMTYWELPTGTIVVDLDTSGCVRLQYEDKINAEISSKEKLINNLDEI